MAPLPDAATLETALDLAARAPSAQNSQPWRWLVSSAGVHLFADRRRQLGDTDADRRDVLVSCGAVLDHCVVALGAGGWDSRLHRFPERGDRDHLALIEVIEAPVTAPGRELAEAIPHRRADRRPYAHDGVPSGTLEMLAVRAARRGASLQVVPSGRWSRHDDGVTLHYGGAAPRPDGHDDRDDRDDGGVLLVLGTDTDDDASRLRAGETMSRLLLSATALGLASCPLSIPLKQTRDRLALAAEVFDGEAYPQVLIRVGLPSAEADPLPAVERLSVAETTTWDISPVG
jgi:nitroreductase